MTEALDADGQAPVSALLGLRLFATRRAAEVAAGADEDETHHDEPSLGRHGVDFTVRRAPEPRTRMHLVPPARDASERVGRQPAVADGPRVEQDQPLDWGLVAAFRQQASKQLMDRLGGDGRRYYAEEEKHEIGRGIIVELLQAHAADMVTRGERGWTAQMIAQMAKAVFDAQFRMGRLQPLLDQDSVENIMITGFDRVVLEDADGGLRDGPPVADSDQELIDFLVFLASRSQVSPRPFSEAIPALHMRLDGGERLAATAWVTPRPSVVIRRHRLRNVTLDDLVRRRTLSRTAESLLRAAVRARRSIVVSGGQGVGKTTLMRALCAEIDPWEPIGTFETEYELGLHEMPEQHRIAHAWEARPGSGEIGANGRRAGEYTQLEEIIDSMRFNLTRSIVGEVRGPEAWQMIKVMESAPGSLCTTHAPNARAAMRKLVSCAMETGPTITAELATNKLAETVNLIVQIHSEIERGAGAAARRVRYVSEIIAITPGELAKGYAFTDVFRHVPGHGAVAHTLPEELQDLVRYGFDADAFHAEAADWKGGPR